MKISCSHSPSSLNANKSKQLKTASQRNQNCKKLPPEKFHDLMFDINLAAYNPCHLIPLIKIMTLGKLALMMSRAFLLVKGRHKAS